MFDSTSCKQAPWLQTTPPTLERAQIQNCQNWWEKESNQKELVYSNWRNTRCFPVDFVAQNEREPWQIVPPAFCSTAEQVGIEQAGESRFLASWAGGRDDHLKARASRSTWPWSHARDRRKHGWRPNLVKNDLGLILDFCEFVFVDYTFTHHESTGWTELWLCADFWV